MTFVLIQFFFNKIVEILAKIFPHCKYLSIIVPLFKLLDILHFILIHVPSYLIIVKHKALFFDGFVEFGVLILEFIQVFLPNKITIGIARWPVDQLRSLVVNALEASDLEVAPIPHFVFYVPVDVVSEVYCCILNENYHIHCVEFLKNYLFFEDLTRLKLLKEHNQKTSVWLIRQGEVWVLILAL